jgi:4,5-DOPA dioxygenase extradiol
MQSPVFVSHGAPTMILEDVPARTFLSGLGATLGRPKAIVVVSAHWESEAPLVSTAARPQTIHDFYGFPEALYQLQYPAQGAPDLAASIVARLNSAGFSAKADAARGLDHGAWAPLLLMYPEADIPVFQLSIQPQRDPAHHVAVGRALAPLRDEGVLVLASGSATHNLRALDWQDRANAPAWAREFDGWLETAIESGDTEGLVNYRRQAPHAVQAHPRDEHLLPLFVAYGAAGEGAKGKRLHASFTHGGLSMAAYRFES